MIEYDFECPYCWENQLKMIDSTIEKQIFIEDCEVCCNPIEFKLSIINNHIVSFSALQIGQ